MKDFPVYDDVGSFPLPEYIDKELFNQYYWTAYKGIVNRSNLSENRGIYNYVFHPILQSFQLKLNAGVEIINYPQHMDMNEQFLKPIRDYQEEPGYINPEKAVLPEIYVLKQFAKDYFNRTQHKLNLKACVTGPIELYLKEHSFTIYKDIALNFAKSVNSFIKSSLLNTNYVETSIISIDEPSFGYVELFNVSKDDLTDIFDKSLENIDVVSQIHLHSLNHATVALQSKNIDVLTSEYASNKQNVISKQLLVEYDKFIRVGITRTNIDNLLAEKLDSGKSYDELKTYNGMLSLIDSEESIERNLNDGLRHYGDCLKYVGPDCGLSGWYPPQVAYELLYRTRKVIEKVKKNSN